MDSSERSSFGLDRGSTALIESRDLSNVRKRVLLMISSMRGGGSERQVLLLAQHLCRDRFDVHLYLSDAAGAFLDHVPVDVTIHVDPKVANGMYFPGRRLRQQIAFVRSVIEQHQIDVVYDRTFHMTMLAGPAAVGVRRVSTIVSPPHLAVPFVEHRFVWLKRKRLAKAYRGSDVVVAVSKQAAESAERFYGLPSGSVVVIPNPVSVDWNDSPQAANETALRQQTRLLCVGRMTAEKGHADLIDAMAHAVESWPATKPPPELRLVGDGPLRFELEQQSHALQLDAVCKFLGKKNDAMNEICAADALILPSRFEGMPNVVLEAMAVGTPVIATRSGGTVELQRDQPTAFWAEVANPKSLGEAILEFSRHPDRAQQHRHSALDLIERHHRLEVILAKIESLLDPR